MALGCSFQVGLILWASLRRCQISSAADPLSVVEGQSKTLICSGVSTTTQRRSLFWVVTEPDAADSLNQAACHSTEPSCRNYDHRYDATANFTDKYYTSTLTILKVSQQERFVTFDCTYYEEETDCSYDIVSWNMSGMLYPPESPACNAVYNVQETTVNVTCSTAKVFPGIVCKFYEIYEGSESGLTAPEIKYSYKEGSTIVGYRNAECSIVTSLSKPGMYKYKVEMYPGLTDSELLKEAARNVYTNEVSVPGKPEVYIKSQIVCTKHINRLSFLCTARWLPSPAEVVWSKNATLISNTTTTNFVDSGFYMSESSVELENVNSNVGPIHCEVNYKTSGAARKKTIKKELLVDISVPPVYFLYNGMFLGNNLVLEEGKTPGNFSCRVYGSNPAIYAIHVECHTPDKVNNESSLSEYVLFHINPIKSMELGICYCSATHKSGCYNSTANFTFSFAHAAYSRSIYQSRWSESYVSNIYYIAAGCVGLVFLVFFLGTIMFLVSRWSELYTYVYGKIYSQAHEETVVGTDGSLQYYSVASVVTADSLLPRSRGQIALHYENIIEGDNMASATSSFCSQHIYSNVDVDSDEEFTQRTDIPEAFHQLSVETNKYNPLTKSVIPNRAASRMIDSIAKHDRSIKSSRPLRQSDLFGISLHTYNKARSPPKPCTVPNCPDLLLHRPFLRTQISSSDDEQQSQTIYKCDPVNNYLELI